MSDNNEPPYIDRALHIDGKKHSIADLADRLGVAIVLAEPGAGKTRLLKELAARLDASVVRASIFRYRKNTAAAETLIIDAFDEVAKLDNSAIDQIIVKASETSAKKIIFSSRSGEWEDSRTKTVTDAFAKEPIIVRLNPFEYSEQKSFFETVAPEENFDHFITEVERVELQPLAGTPQFLRMLIDAYIENNSTFESKLQIYRDSVRYAAREKNTETTSKLRPPVEAIIEHSERLFSILLLSGSSGVSTSDSSSSRDFPKLNALIDDNDEAYALLDSNLFQPTGITDQHQTTHRIITEYCAGSYLTDRIRDDASLLSLEKLLTLIAPNNIVRDELRGLLSWIAAFGDQTTQTTIIKLDPYSVMANGDPGQLSLESKRLLLDEVVALSNKDPYFRRTDRYRRFNVGGFFSEEVIEQVGRSLIDPQTTPSLKTLLLELLIGVSGTNKIKDELKSIYSNKVESLENRQLALDASPPLSVEETKAYYDLFIAETTCDGLALASKMAIKVGLDKFSEDELFNFLQALASQYKEQSEKKERGNYGSFFFARDFFSKLQSLTVERLLDRISSTYKCGCDKKRGCRCFQGSSKVIGHLLDRYFELKPINVDPSRLVQWTRHLSFENQKNPDASTSVRYLSENHGLRRSVQQSYLQGLNSGEEVWNVMVDQLMWRAHSGLTFKDGDHIALAEYAFDSDNSAIWEALYGRHNIYRKEKGSEPLRTLMRAQSRQKPELLRVWSKKERSVKTIKTDKDELRHRRKMKRYRARDEKIGENNKQHYFENRELIESGRHWGWTKTLSMRLFYGKDSEEPLDYISEDSALKTLRNSFPMLLEHVPSLADVSAPSTTYTFVALKAACYAWYREFRNLISIDQSILRAVRADFHPTANISSEETRPIEVEINRLIFHSEDDIRQFAQEYLEPQLADEKRQHTDVRSLLQEDEFSNQRISLALDWLERFSRMHFSAREYLFAEVTKHKETEKVHALVRQKLRDAKKAITNSQTELDQEIYNFWSLRAFLFLPFEGNPAMGWLKEDKRNIFALERVLGSLHREEHSSWIVISADKIFAIFDAFVDEWPKVELPDSWGTGSPDEETAYRFLTEVIWLIRRDENFDRLLSALDYLLADSRFESFDDIAKTLKVETLRHQALQDFEAPHAEQVATFLDESSIVSVENLRAVVIDTLRAMQDDILGGSTDIVETFYNGKERVNETTAAKRIADYFIPRLNALNLDVAIETHLHSNNRCDITISTVIDGKPILLVIETKGQWHRELFSAAEEQLHKRYSHHPNAEEQGVYLVFWFGDSEQVAGKANSYTSANALREALEGNMDSSLRNRIDVFVLDVERK